MSENNKNQDPNSEEIREIAPAQGGGAVLEMMSADQLNATLDLMDGFEDVALGLSFEFDLKIKENESKNFVLMGFQDVTMNDDTVKNNCPILMDSARVTYLGVNKLIVDAFNPSSPFINPGSIYSIKYLGEEKGKEGKYKNYKVALMKNATPDVSAAPETEKADAPKKEAAKK